MIKILLISFFKDLKIEEKERINQNKEMIDKIDYFENNKLIIIILIFI